MSNRSKSPYEQHSAYLAEQLQDQRVNSFEHGVNWPRFKALLPYTARKVLDFGCGAGNFTNELANMYPGADVLGVDASQAMLGEAQSDSRARFSVWAGQEPLSEEGFDLITAKLSLHYLDDDNLRAASANLTRCLAPGGRIAFSVPSPFSSMAFNNAKRSPRESYHLAGSYTREIGNTGIQATMIHRRFTDWLYLFKDQLADYTVLSDEPVNENNVPVRLNVLTTPISDSSAMADIYNRLRDITQGTAVEEVAWADPGSELGHALMYGTPFSFTTKQLP